MNDTQYSSGDDNVVIGNNRTVNGSRNVIIDATDRNGNTILNHPMIVGYGAKGSPTDMVIGANAVAGSELFLLLDQLATATDGDTKNQVIALATELKSDHQDTNKIKSLWTSIQTVVTAVDLIAKIGPLLTPFLASK